jgi:hypothetical protein
MRDKLTSTTLAGWVWIAFILAAAGETTSRGAGLKLEVQLLWATDATTSPNPKHKPVGADLNKKLKQLPLKWSNYFEETRKMVEIPQGESKTVGLSGSCELEVKNLGGSKIAVTHFGKGKKVGTRIQELPRGEVLVLGGNAPDSTAWLVVLKRIE